MSNCKKKEASIITKCAIESHNDNISRYNQHLSLNEFDNALTEVKNIPLSDIYYTKNDGSTEAEIVQKYRDEVTIKHTGDWVSFLLIG